MARNVFSGFKDFVEKPKRNTFDLSFQNNLSCKFGDLVPVFCKEVVPGDSFSIKPSFGFRFAPMVFPIQTRIKANIHFFYVRSRNLWEDWPDFIGDTKDSLVMPFINQPNSFFKTGSLADYLGVPSTVFGTYQHENTLSMTNAYYLTKGGSHVDFTTINDGDVISGFAAQNAIEWDEDDEDLTYMKFSSSTGTLTNEDILKSLTIYNCILPVTSLYKLCLYSVDSQSLLVLDNSDVEDVSEGTFRFNDPYTTKAIEFVKNNTNIRVAVLFAHQATPTVDGPSKAFDGARYYLFTAKNGDITTLPDSVKPYGILQSEQTRISALPFRAYESIYNSFYRNNQVDPYRVDGVPEYNKFCIKSAGADSTPYAIRQRPWEYDFLTTAVHSPQQGIAPLVGITSNGKFTFDNGDGTTSSMEVTVGKDGNTIEGIKSVDKDLQGSTTLRAMVDLVSNGISINDFRNVNSLQRWLETNIRRGYRYKEQILSHYGVDTDYSILDMPEFIGGVSRPVNVSQINQTATTEVGGKVNELGEYAGQASVVGEGNEIHHYCDEHGYIIGILSIVPTPIYSQLLPKHFVKANVLDYYFPEFGHLGLQPIQNREVCPINSYLAYLNDNYTEDKPTGEFGYQRAWYDYLSSPDEAHGLFRTELRNFLLNRTFVDVPKLGHDFVSIIDSQLTNVFVNEATSDKIFGLINFEVHAKRPIPMVGIPRLE